MRVAPTKRVCICAAVLTMILAVAAAIAACASDTQESTAADGSVPGGTLSVFAAAGLKNSFTELAKLFDQESGAQTSLVFDAAGVLQKQIAAGADADVFASSDPKFMTALVEKGFVDGPAATPFAGNTIVLIVPAGSASGIAGFQDLANTEVQRIAVADPKVTPLGQMTVDQILPQLGIAEQVKPKLIYAQTVAQTLEYVNRKEVDAGIVWASEARAGGDRIEIVAVADSNWHSAVVFVIGAVSRSRNGPLAQAFVDFIVGPRGQSVLQAHGFSPAPLGD